MSLTTLASQPLIFIIWLMAILIALSVHEFSHAWMATILGDQTAKRMGRLSLNPMAHIDWFGLLALVFAHFGWGKPVPYNPNYLKFGRWGEVLVALAGPGSNLVQLIVAGILLRILGPMLGGANLLVNFLGFYFLINTVLMIFNLIPLPPLDGSKLLFALLYSQRWRSLRYSIERYGSFVLMGVVMMDIVLGFGILSTIIGWPLNLITNIFGLGNFFGL